jgi:hypothetical protein
MRSIQWLATTCDVDCLLLPWISVTITNVKFHGVTCHGFAAHAFLDIEEHLHTILSGND